MKLTKPLVENGRALWLEIVARVTVGRVGISLLDKADNLIDERFAEEGTEPFRFYFLLDPTPTGLIVRSSEIPYSVIEIERIAIVSDADAIPLGRKGLRVR